MSLPVPTEPPACVICGGRLADGPTIPTTSGGAVHIHCAEAQAKAAAQRRTVCAAMSAVVGVGGWALNAAGGGLGSLLLAVLLIAAHILINRRWWSYTVQRAQLWWRMHR
jgi:hypothetical protein